MSGMEQMELGLVLPPTPSHRQALDKRVDPMFLRNQFDGTGKWGLPFVCK